MPTRRIPKTGLATGTYQDRSSFLIQLQEVLEQHFQNPEFDLDQMAAAMDVGERQLQRKLKSLTGHTPAEHLRTFRLNRSIEYLRKGGSIGATAKAVGFSSQAYFTSCFKAQFSVTPSKFQRGLM